MRQVISFERRSRNNTMYYLYKYIIDYSYNPVHVNIKFPQYTIS